MKRSCFYVSIDEDHIQLLLYYESPTKSPIITDM